MVSSSSRNMEEIDINPIAVPRSLSTNSNLDSFTSSSTSTSTPTSIPSALDHRRVSSSLFSSHQPPPLPPTSSSSFAKTSSFGPIRSERITSASPPARHQPYSSTSSIASPPSHVNAPRRSQPIGPNLLTNASASTSMSPAGSSLGILIHESETRPRNLIPPSPKSQTSLPPLQIPSLPALPTRSRSNSLNRNVERQREISPSEWSPSTHKTSTSNAITLPPLLPLSSGRPRSITLGRKLPPVDLEGIRDGKDGDWRHKFDGPSPPQQFEFLREADRERRAETASKSSRDHHISPDSYTLPFMESIPRPSVGAEGGLSGRASLGLNSAGERRGESSLSPNPSFRSQWDRRFMEPDPSPRQRYRAMTFHSPEFESEGSRHASATTGFAQSSNRDVGSSASRDAGISRWSRESYALGGFAPLSSQNYTSVSPSLSDSALQFRSNVPSSTYATVPAQNRNAWNESRSGRLAHRSSSTSIPNSHQHVNSHHHINRNQSIDPALSSSGLPCYQSHSSSIGSGSQSSFVSEADPGPPPSSKRKKPSTSKIKSSASASNDNNPKLVMGPARSRRAPKSHVVSACVNCKSAHLACDVERPCNRCIQMGRTDSCVDVQHKKRGRPRLLKHEKRAASNQFQSSNLAGNGGSNLNSSSHTEPSLSQDPSSKVNQNSSAFSVAPSGAVGRSYQ